MNAYLDSSVALRRLLGQPGALTVGRRWECLYASVLLRVESRRVADRLRLAGSYTDPQLAALAGEIATFCKSIRLVPVDDWILERAGQSFPTVLGTLDALHLATALSIRERRNEALTILTHDVQFNTAARSLGFPVEGV